MKLLVFGGTGQVGSRILNEALSRGHRVTAVVRRERDDLPDGVTTVLGDVLDTSLVSDQVVGYDAVISAVGGAGYGEPDMVVRAARSLVGALGHGLVRRLVVVGGAGSLEVAPGVQLVDTPEFHEDWKPSALAQRDALDVYRELGKNLTWTYVSPSDIIEPGERTGHYEVSLNRMIRNSAGESKISIEDFAKAIIDEVEHPRHIRERFTVGYA